MMDNESVVSTREAKTKSPPDITKPPASFSSLTTEYMLEYVKKNGTKEDIIWFKELVEKNIITVKKTVKGGKKNKTDGETEKTVVNISVANIRREFCQKYFIYLVPKPKLSKVEAFIEQVRNL